MPIGCRVDPPNQQVSPQVDILINMSVQPGSALGGLLNLTSDTDTRACIK